MKISLCMIVKDEEKYIKMCLDNALKLADEAIIVDTGSTDNTKEILKEYGSKVKVIDYKWENDFSKARNRSLEKAAGDWILILDADEKLLCDCVKIKEILEGSQYEGYAIPLYNIVTTKTIIYSAVFCKLFRNNGYRYEGAIHEQLNIENYYQRTAELDKSICQVIHYGYLDSVMKERNKSKRNLEILEEELKKDPDNPFIYYNIGVCYHVTGKYDEALNYFFKCNEAASKISLNEITKYEVDMVKRMAECFFKLEKYEICIDFVDGLINDAAYKGFVDLLYIKGHCYNAMKNYEKAIDAFQECINIGETTKFVSVTGMGSFLPKNMIASIYAILGQENKAINYYIECIFDPNNFMKEGLDTLRNYLSLHRKFDILNELNRLVGDNKK